MAQERIRQWALRFVPEKVDEESRTKKIRCQTETQILDTWEAPFAGREQWCQEMEDLLLCVADQLPMRKHGIQFTAEDAAGNVISQTTTTITGKNKDAADMGAANGVKALTDAMNSVSQTMDKTLQMSQRQLEAGTKALAAMSDEVQDLHAMLRARRALDTVQGVDAGGDEIAKIAFAKLDQYGPTILELGKMYLETKGATSGASTGSPAARAIVQAVTSTNGKAAS